ncbi:MAG: serine protease, partial [Gammaproteobacteria bacterium]
VFFGTGFVVGDGTLVVTNAHVVDREAHFDENERLMVFVHREGRDRGIPVQVLRRDERHDLAVLRLHGGRLPALALAGPGRRVREGDEVLFTGYPIGTVLGLYPVTHRGMVSAIVPIAIPAGRSRELTPERIHGLRHPFPVYQLDATAYPGNSGSPVYDPHSGRVLGIINMVFVKKRRENALREPSGISYAIPVAHLRRLLAGLAGAP